MNQILITPVTRFTTSAKAETIAAAIRANDSAWSYAVRESGDAFVIVAFDEAGVEIGAL
jgi:hypothetical protein